MNTQELIDARLAREWINRGIARSIREGSGLTKGDVARTLGVSRSAVDRWESGERRPRTVIAASYGRLLRDLATSPGRGTA